MKHRSLKSPAIFFLAGVFCLMAVPSLSMTTAHAYNITTIQFDKVCSEGMVVTKTVSTPGGWHYEITDVIPCSHGSVKEHRYNSATGIVAGIYESVGITNNGQSLTYTTSGDPDATESQAIQISCDDAKNQIEKNLADKGITATITSLESPSNMSYYVYCRDYSITWSSDRHIPIQVGGSTNKDGNLWDLYSGTFEISGADILDPISVNTSALSGFGVSAAESSGHGELYTCESAVYCPAGMPKITGEHKKVTSTSSSGNYFDANGNILGGYTTIHKTCAACGAKWDEGGGNIKDDYEGNIYDSNGNIVGYVGSSGSSDQYGPNLTYLQGGYTYSTKQYSTTNGCYTVTYTPCQTHHMIGPHYYCTTHNYIGSEKEHYYSLDGQYYIQSVYGYAGDNQYIDVFKVTVQDNSICKGYSSYASSVGGNNIKITLTTKPAQYRYTISTSDGAVLDQGVSSADSLTFTMPFSDVVVAFSQAKEAQALAGVKNYKTNYNDQGFNLGITVV